MRELDLKNNQQVDTTEVLILDKDERDCLHYMKKRFEEFSRIIKIHEEY